MRKSEFDFSCNRVPLTHEKYLKPQVIEKFHSCTKFSRKPTLDSKELTGKEGVQEETRREMQF